MLDTNGYKLISVNGNESVYRKWDPVLRIRTTIRFTDVPGDSDKRNVHVCREQPRGDIQSILDLNVARQNEGSGHKGDGLHQASCIPISIYQQIMEKCGHQPGHGHDEKRFKKILNDRDYYKLKTVSGRI